MLNYIWAVMIVGGILYAVVTGNMQSVSNGVISSSKEAITLCVTMLGVMSLWTGLMEIAKTSGIIRQLTKLINPFVNYMFPDIPKEHSAREYITTNIIANILGLGWAATPAGLRAMKALSELEKERSECERSGGGELSRKCKSSHKKEMTRKQAGRISDKTGRMQTSQESDKTVRKQAVQESDKLRIASNEMCTFLVINISSLQIIPVNIIAYRSQYGSINPAIITVPAIIATTVSTITGIIYCKIRCRK